MPISASVPKPRTLQRGFTLIEMLVVLALIALVAALALPRLGAAPSRAGQERVRTVMTILTDARSMAVASGRAQALDPALLGAGAHYIAAVGPSEHILFYPDGSSSGGKLTLAPGRVIGLGLADGRTDLAHD